MKNDIYVCEETKDLWRLSPVMFDEADDKQLFITFVLPSGGKILAIDLKLHIWVMPNNPTRCQDNTSTMTKILDSPPSFESRNF